MAFQNQIRELKGKAALQDRPLVPFKYYVHDSITGFRFQLLGSLTERHVAELAGCWTTARTILGPRQLIVDLRALDSTDEAGKQWLLSLAHDNAQYWPESYFRDGLAAQNESTPCQYLGILGRVFSLFRGRHLPAESSTRVP